jgi:hypothetical protein
MRHFLLLVLLVVAFMPSVAQATDAQEADAHWVAVHYGVYAPIRGDDRWVYTGSCNGSSLVVSYRVQTADKATTMVRIGGVVVGRWERQLSTNLLDELIFGAGCWDYLHTLAGS